MPYLIKIPIENEVAHSRFEWQSGSYKKLIAVFCSPGVQLALVFNNGKKVFLRNWDKQKSSDIPPNSRVFFVDKDLDNEIISGVVSKNPKERHKSIYLIVEK